MKSINMYRGLWIRRIGHNKMVWLCAMYLILIMILILALLFFILSSIRDIRDSLAPRAVNLLLRELLILYRCATLVSPRSGSRNQPEREKTEKTGIKNFRTRKLWPFCIAQVWKLTDFDGKSDLYGQKWEKIILNIIIWIIIISREWIEEDQIQKNTNYGQFWPKMAKADRLPI